MAPSAFWRNTSWVAGRTMKRSPLRLIPETAGDTPSTVEGSTDYSANADGLLVAGHSMQFKLDSQCPGGMCHAWAYQEFVVPTFISGTQPVDIEMTTTRYGLVPPAQVGKVGRLEDKLRLVIKDQSGADLTQPVVVIDGAEPIRGVFHGFERDMVPLFDGSSLLDHVGETLRFRLYANNTDGQGSSWFHLDQIRCDICTTVQPPEPEPTKVLRLGGRLLVILEGRPTPMSGIDVWAVQLPDGVTPPEELAVYTTYSIQDSTFNFYNLNPGRYRIYAEVWVSGNLYSAVTTIQVNAGDSVADVNLNLL